MIPVTDITKFVNCECVLFFFCVPKVGNVNLFCGHIVTFFAFFSDQNIINVLIERIGHLKEWMNEVEGDR